MLRRKSLFCGEVVMKRALGRSTVLAAVMVVVACAGVVAGGGGDGGGSVGPCAGPYAGTYEGTITGTLSGTTSSDGTFTISFLPDGDTTPISGGSKVMSDGSLAFNVGGNDIKGRLDRSTCIATGTWMYSTFGNGTWEMHLIMK